LTAEASLGGAAAHLFAHSTFESYAVCLQYVTQGNVSINWLVSQLRTVNSTVIALTGGMLTAYDQLSSANTQLVSNVAASHGS